MERLQAFKFELQPNGEQQRNMRRFAGSCRFVFNKALALQQERREQGEKKLSYAGLCKVLTEWKAQPETIWLKETHSQPLQQTLKDLERAYVNFFEKRADFPRFKKKGMGDSFRFPQGCKLEQTNSRIFLPKLGWLRYPATHVPFWVMYAMSRSVSRAASGLCRFKLGAKLKQSNHKAALSVSTWGLPVSPL